MVVSELTQKHKFYFLGELVVLRYLQKVRGLFFLQRPRDVGRVKLSRPL